MKKFQFRLEQALQWRATQADLEKARVAETATRIAELRIGLESRRGELKSGARDLIAGATGFALESWTPYARRATREIGEVEKQLKEAERQFGERLRVLVEANRKLRLLENLKSTAEAKWNAGVQTELEAFAGEAFLVGYNRKERRARSSGG